MSFLIKGRLILLLSSCSGFELYSSKKAGIGSLIFSLFGEVE